MKKYVVYSLLLLIALTSLSLTVSAAEDEDNWMIPVKLGKDGWMLYENSRFGTRFPVPPGMIAQRPPDNGRGQSFASADGKVVLSGGGHFNTEDSRTIEESWQSALADRDRTITYQVKKADWYVVSGITKDGRGFYEKYTANKKYGAGWSITYPQADEKKYTAWIERIAKDFEPRFGKGYDTVD